MKVDIVSAYHNVTLESCRLEVAKEITEDDGITSSFALHVVPCGAGVSLSVELGIDDPDKVVDCLLYSPHLIDSDVGDTIIDRIASCKARVVPDPARSATAITRMQTAGIDPKYWPDPNRTARQIILAGLGVTDNTFASLRTPKRLAQEQPHMLSTAQPIQVPAEPAPKPKRTFVTLDKGKKVVKYGIK